MEQRRIYRVTGARAPRLLFELSRIGERAGSQTVVVSQERYRVDEGQVSIDHLEPLGWFCVITAERAETVAQLADRLELESGDLEARSYAELLGASGLGKPAATRALGLSGRSLRLLLMALAGTVLAFFDLGLGALALAVLLLLEWGFGAPDGAGRSGGPAPA